MARKYYERDADGNIVMKVGKNKPKCNIPRPLKRIGKILMGEFRDSTVDPEPEPTPEPQATRKGPATVADPASVMPLNYEPMEIPVASLDPDGFKEPFVSEPDSKVEPSVSVEPSASIEPSVSVEPDVSVEPNVISEPDVSTKPKVSVDAVDDVKPKVSVDDSLNKMLPNSQKVPKGTTTILKGQERFDALQDAGAFVDIINWAKNSGNTNVALLKHGGLNWANNLDPNDLSKEDYKKLFRALSYSVDTATIDREGYNLYKKIEPIFKIKR